MPGHRIHRFSDRELYGKTYPRIHIRVDLPYLFLGSKHRVLFHDPVSAAFIAKASYPLDPNAINSGLSHILLDQLCSADPAFKNRLEFLANREMRKRAQIRKENTSRTKKRKRSHRKSKSSANRRKSDPFKEYMRYCKKLKIFP